MGTTTVNLLLNKYEIPVWVLIVLVIWTLIWKGPALWKAARSSKKTWFIVLLLVNTVGILDIIYLFAIDRKTKNETIQPESIQG